MKPEEIKLREECATEACETLTENNITFANDESEVECINIISGLIVQVSELQSTIDQQNAEIEHLKRQLTEVDKVAMRDHNHFQDEIKDLHSEVKFHCVEKDKLEKQLSFEKQNANDLAEKCDEYRKVISENRSRLIEANQRGEKLKWVARNVLKEATKVYCHYNEIIKNKNESMDFKTLKELNAALSEYESTKVK